MGMNMKADACIYSMGFGTACLASIGRLQPEFAPIRTRGRRQARSQAWGLCSRRACWPCIELDVQFVRLLVARFASPAPTNCRRTGHGREPSLKVLVFFPSKPSQRDSDPLRSPSRLHTTSSPAAAPTVVCLARCPPCTAEAMPASSCLLPPACL